MDENDREEFVDDLRNAKSSFGCWIVDDTGTDVRVYGERGDERAIMLYDPETSAYRILVGQSEVASGVATPVPDLLIALATDAGLSLIEMDKVMTDEGEDEEGPGRRADQLDAYCSETHGACGLA